MELISILEIGVEDLPSKMVKDALGQLRERGKVLLKSYRVNYRKITTWGSSQRLILYIEGIQPKQEDVVEKEAGPPRRVVFDSEGRLTKAGRGYLEAKKATREQLEIETSEKGEYVYIKRYHRGRKTISVLPRLFTELIGELHFPKSMRWRENNFSFGRPIRYILALLGEEIVQFEIAGIRSGRKSRGHRYLHPKLIDIPSATYYPEIMRKARVIIDPEERRRRIIRQIGKVISQLKDREYREVQIIPDEELLEELTYLVEYPTVFWGDFDPGFLSLPSFILKACLREYQQHFTVSGEKGILPFFVGVREGGKYNLQNIVEGNRRVLHARLKDAQFFYQEDQKIPLDKRVFALREIVVQEKLGSYYDKVKRMLKLVEKFSAQLEVPEEVREKILRAAYLCKADLVTNMVREFPELQGIAGGNYALQFGEDPRVAKAIQEHRRPRFSKDELPQSTEGAILAITDKMDTLAGAFWIDFIPSGSEDPWGLRREAQGVIEIILDKRFDLSLKKLIDESMNLYGEKKEAREKLREFLQGRIVTLLRERGATFDQINAVMKVGKDDLVDLVTRARALQHIATREEFKEEIVAIIRLLNILKQARDWGIEVLSPIKEEKLVEKEEKDFYRCWKRMRVKVAQLLNNREYKKAYERLSELKEPIHNFFEKVLVMSEDQELRLNRLALLQEIGWAFLRIADFTELKVK